LQSRDSEASPTQTVPPFSGAGDVHVLVFDWVPAPQETEQDAQALQSVQPPLTGQGLVLQASCSVPEPWQFAPPFAGAGLLHVLERDLVPPPQEAEQADKSDHADHPPSTGHA